MTYTTFDDALKYMKRRENKDGSFTYAFYKKYQGKPMRLKLGICSQNEPARHIDSAYHKVMDMVEKGEPYDTIQATFGKKPTLGAFFTEFQERHAMVENQKCHWKNNESVFRCHLTHLAKVKINNITTKQIRDIIDSLKDNPATANQVIALMSILFNKAKEWGYLPHTHLNPTKKVKKLVVPKRKRILNEDELPRVKHELESIENKTHRAMMKLALLTGLRQKNIRELKWQYINWTDKTITIPRTKNGDPHSVTLTPEMEVILNEMKKGIQHIEYVFYSPSSAKGHVVNINKSWDKLRKRANIEDVRLHDLRRTCGSLIYKNTGSLRAVANQLGHKNLKVTEIYAQETPEQTKLNALAISAEIGRNICLRN